MNSGLDLSQELAIGGQSIALGLLVVFVCLALIIAVITVLSIVLKDRKKPAEESGVEKAVSEPLPQSPVLQVQDDELLAVLTAEMCIRDRYGYHDAYFQGYCYVGGQRGKPCSDQDAFRQRECCGRSGGQSPLQRRDGNPCRR